MLREKELKLLEDLKTDNARKTEEIRQLRKNQLIGQASGEEIVTITDGADAFSNILKDSDVKMYKNKFNSNTVTNNMFISGNPNSYYGGLSPSTFQGIYFTPLSII